MTLGVYDRDFQLNHALSIVRRYVDRNAQLNKERTGIIYWRYGTKRKWQPAIWQGGGPILTKKGNPIETPQYVKECFFMSAADALQMVADLNQE